MAHFTVLLKSVSAHHIEKQLLSPLNPENIRTSKWLTLEVYHYIAQSTKCLISWTQFVTLTQIKTLNSQSPLMFSYGIALSVDEPRHLRNRRMCVNTFRRRPTQDFHHLFTISWNVPNICSFYGYAPFLVPSVSPTWATWFVTY